MSKWGIADTAPENEKIKAELNDFLMGMNSCGDISYSAYSEIYDKAMECLDKMYKLCVTKMEEDQGIKEGVINNGYDI